MDPISAFLLALTLAGEPAKPLDGYKLNDKNRVESVDCSDVTKWFDREHQYACGRPDGGEGTSSAE